MVKIGHYIPWMFKLYYSCITTHFIVIIVYI